ncbi:MAG: histidinol-phosphatase [Bacteroidales bacterium]|nr:histidinol-phosphatase [Bacteroidales bacterium]
MISNFHTHSRHCDGRGELREYVEYALSKGFKALGFSGHAPVPFPNNFSIKDDDYLNYCNEVRALKAEYAGRIDIRLGLEIDYIPGLLEDFTPLVEQGGLDYTIGSVHLIPNPNDVSELRHLSATAKGDERQQIPYHLWFIDGPRQETYDNGLHHIFGDDIRAGVRAYFYQQNAMIEQNKPTIVGHPDKIVMHNRERYFSCADRWYRDLLFETLQLIAETGCICELNTRGLYKGRHTDYYPSKEAVRFMDTLGIPLLVSTDAHQPSDLDCSEGAFDFLAEIGYRNIVCTI